MSEGNPGNARVVLRERRIKRRRFIEVSNGRDETTTDLGRWKCLISCWKAQKRRGVFQKQGTK
jgi:hypothetical protein